MFAPVRYHIKLFAAVMPLCRPEGVSQHQLSKGKAAMPPSSSEQCTVYRLSGIQVRFDRLGVAIGRGATCRSPAERLYG